jgi:gamma-glutamylcyclotransferase (GGCT)/AIG2-like uncharacterized protein YtfP
MKLEHILKIAKSDHKLLQNIEIMKQPDIKNAHIYCKINQLSGQVSGSLIEYYIKNKYDMIKNKPSLCKGDSEHKKVNIEIKISTGGKYNNKFNYVQLRMNHNCIYILTAYYIDESNLNDLGELFIFKLNKENMKHIILNYGGYAAWNYRKIRFNI